MGTVPESTLSRIYHMANPYGFEPVDRVDSGIVGLDVVSGPDGYKITTEVGFFGGGTFGAMTILVKTDGGILNQDGVLRGAEVGKGALPGIITFEAARVEVDELSALLGEPAPTLMHARVVDEPSREALYLPGDPGFELFRMLHSKVGQIAKHVGTVTRLLKLGPSPVFSFKQDSGGAHYHHDRGTVTYSLTDRYGLGISKQEKEEMAALVRRGDYQIPSRPDRRHMLDVRMEQTVPINTAWPKDPEYNQVTFYDAADYRLLSRYPESTGDAIVQTWLGTVIAKADVPDLLPAFTALRRSLTALHAADTKPE